MKAMGQVVEKVVVVKTKNELREAMKSGCQEIYVQGSLASKIRNAYRAKKVLPILGTKFGSKTPTVGALSVALKGVELAVILAIVFLGLALLIWMTREYELGVEIGPKGVKLVKKKKLDDSAKASGECEA